MLATVLFFVTIVLDEVRPKVMCIHTKLIIVWHTLRAVKKRETACSLFVMFAVGARTVKNVLFCSIMRSIEKKCLDLTITGKQSNIKVGPW